jgi:peptidoglycan/LPS O-acetylase OafA/YrhL
VYLALTAPGAAIGSFLVLEVVDGVAPWHTAGPLAGALCIPGFALLIAAYADRDRCGGRPTFASAPAMVKLGEWSFALYLVHELVLRTALELGPAPKQEQLRLISGAGAGRSAPA